MQHPKPWWYRLAERIAPHRCREIPEAQNPDRIVLRQVALVYRHVYLQQFASGEDPRFMHSHQWRRMIAIGLWGKYSEARISGPDRVRRAPYFYTMDASVVHHVQEPGPGHTSIFIGLGRDDDLKFYYGAPDLANPEGYMVPSMGQKPATYRTPWHQHIQKMVKRI